MLKEFRDFILRGKVGELAVAVLIGAAFTGLVGSLTKDIINPLLAALLGRPDFSAFVLNVHGGKVAYGNFLNAVIAFTLVCAVVFFLIVTPLGFLLKKVGVPFLPGTKGCPWCFSEIPPLATVCKFCTREVPPEQVAHLDLTPDEANQLSILPTPAAKL